MSVCFPDPTLPPVLQGKKPAVLSVPSPWALSSRSSSAFWHILVSQRHSPSWCPTTRFILTAPCHRLFFTLDGPLPDMLWLLAPSVLFHPGQCQKLSPHLLYILRGPCLGLRDEERHLASCRLGSRSTGLSCSPCPHTRSHFLLQPLGCHVPHASGDLRHGRGWAPFPGTCPGP